ncbi:hypothetical protein BHE74_00008035 [Ensete ventricosum]|nr:hypothetical protein BHE74_00008035 [Ensete ventricosum]
MKSKGKKGRKHGSELTGCQQFFLLRSKTGVEWKKETCIGEKGETGEPTRTDRSTRFMIDSEKMRGKRGESSRWRGDRLFSSSRSAATARGHFDAGLRLLRLRFSLRRRLMRPGHIEPEFALLAIGLCLCTLNPDPTWRLRVEMAPLKELLEQDSFWRRRRTKTRPAAVTRAKSMPPNAGERRGKARSHEVAYEKSNTVTLQEEAVCFEVDMQPAICDAATQAVVSILTGYIEEFLKHESFRASLRRRCNACLGIASELGVFAELEEAIAMIERVVEERRGVKELQKASLKLGVISGFTAGFPSSRLSACAHLYLSVICKIRKKDRMTADHLLQVFCTAPSEARTILLPDLWNQLFLPHLSHLKAWHKKEVESIMQTPSGAKKMKLIDKMYDDVMNRGTHNVAVYYKEWLIEAKKAPSLPSIAAPSASSSRMIQPASHAIDRDDVCSPMVSQKSYEAVLGHLKRMEAANELRIKVSDREEERKKEIEVDQSVLGEFKGSKMINPCSGKRDHLGGESKQSQRLNASSNVSDHFSYTYQHFLKNLTVKSDNMYQ